MTKLQGVKNIEMEDLQGVKNIERCAGTLVR
jgi:hypothetical protein